MFTTQFKVTLVVLVFLVVCGALVVNQLALQNRVAALENEQATKPVMQVVAPTITATPSATLSPTTSVKALPKVPVTTKILATPTTPVK